jgi:hypothetical protein
MNKMNRRNKDNKRGPIIQRKPTIREQIINIKVEKAKNDIEEVGVNETLRVLERKKENKPVIKELKKEGIVKKIFRFQKNK